MLLKLKARKRMQVPAHGRSRAVVVWSRILEEPSQIIIERGGETLEAQWVRIEHGRESFVLRGSSGDVISAQVIIVGVMDHPTQPDFDVKTDDIWFDADPNDFSRYEVERVIREPGQITVLGRRVT